MRQTFGLLVPCHNGAAFLPRLFDSIKSQTRGFDEIWVFDDNSDDQSATVAKQLGAQVIQSDKTIGPSAGRNRLAEACKCDWLHFHDADDTMEPTYLARVSAVALPPVDIVICNMVWIDECTGLVENHWTYDAAQLADRASAYLLINTVGGINGLYRRSAFAAICGFDETLSFWEDMDLNIRLFQQGARCAVISEDLVTAYRRRTSYSNSNLAKVWKVKLQLMQRMVRDANPELASTIAAESENIALRLLDLGCARDIGQALRLCREAGGNPPTTNNFFLRILKALVPTETAFRLQAMRRKHHKA
ncbi:MAG: family 2 glycosyl transferase [Planctomycetaceae bacterium]|nr:family 2 glycosyl transferase [Planctomycetaceae bacterium]